MSTSSFPKWIVICCGGVVGLATFAVVMVQHQQRLHEKIAVTSFDIAYVITSCSNYFASHGRWPASLQDCVAEGGVSTNDAWGHAIAFVPFTPDRGFGIVMSYGRDGRPGGTGPDSDVEARFGK